MPAKSSVTILCSYVTLGVYIPALILHRSLLEKGFDCELMVLEHLFLQSKLSEIPKLKKAYHDNFRFAKTAAKMASKNNSTSIDEEKLNTLYAGWERSHKRHFIIFSGFWNEIVNTYLRNRANHKDFQVDLVHMDADLAPSWKSYDLSYGNIRLIKLFDAAQQKLSFYIPPASEKFNSGPAVKERILIHGGGWGIGTYQQKLAEMIDRGIKLNVVAYETGDMTIRNSFIQYHLLDPQWEPCNNKQFTFPSMQKVSDSEEEHTEYDAYYPYYNLILESVAIISKPGGGTLNDSISAGVPIIFLESFGDHECANAKLWKDLGYGIDYEKWKENNFSIELLEKLRINLSNARKDLKTVYQNYYETN